MGPVLGLSPNGHSRPSLWDCETEPPFALRLPATCYPPPLLSFAPFVVRCGHGARLSSAISANSPPTSDLRPPTSDFRPPTSDPPTSDLRLPTSDLRLPTSDLRLPTSDLRPPTSDFRPPTSDFRPPTSLRPSDLRPPTSDLRALSASVFLPLRTRNDPQRLGLFESLAEPVDGFNRDAVGSGS
jgi:hypothetical protein